MPEILRMENITKRFPGVLACDNAHIELNSGEAMALIGENGAGKSTLMKVLLGLYHPDGGTITLEGKEVTIHNPSEALGMGISMIHQEISLVPQMTVAENVWLGREDIFSKAGFLNVRKRNNATKELINQLGLNIDPGVRVENLNVANMQMVEIIRAVSYNSKIIIMDEPTSALSEAEINVLFKIIRDLKSKGVGIIFISHKIDEIFTICERVTVMRDGKYVDTKYCRDIDHDQLITMIVGRQMTNLFPKEEAEIGEVVFEVKNLSGVGFHNVSFSLRKGEILGFCGLEGAGRTEIMNGVFGITKHTAGEIWLNGEKISIQSPSDAIKNGIGMITEDRLRQGAIHSLSIKTNMSLPHLDEITNKLNFVDQKTEAKECQAEAEKMQVSMTSINMPIGNLSGGNQQKVIIGRWLLTNPKVLIMDEPTRGIDVGAKAEIHRMLSNLAKEGMAIIMVSSELPEILGMSDRIIVVKDGTIVHEQPREGATQEELMKYAFGLAKD